MEALWNILQLDIHRRCILRPSGFFDTMRGRTSALHLLSHCTIDGPLHLFYQETHQSFTPFGLKASVKLF